VASVFAWFALISAFILASRRAIICSISIVWRYSFLLQSPIHPTSDTSCHMYEYDSRWSFWLDIAFIDDLNTLLIITLNYSAIANFHTLQITRAQAKSFLSYSVFTSSCLVTAPTMAIRLLLCSGPLWMVAPFQSH
jgi:hypothetical protein